MSRDGTTTSQNRAKQGRPEPTRLAEVAERPTQDAISDPARLASLQRTGLLDSPPEEIFDRLARMASRALDTPVALISLVDADRQFFKAAVGLSHPLATERQTPLTHSYCQYVVTSGEELFVEDARRHPLLKDNPAIQDYDAISYCGLPLIDQDGRVLGTLCAVDDKPRAWTSKEISALQDIVRSVTAEIHLRIVSAELADVNAALQEFVAVASHDLRNPLSAILGFAELLADENTTPQERAEFVATILNEGKRANRLVSDLLEVSRLEANAVPPMTELVDIRSAVASVLAARPRLAVEFSVPEGLLVVTDRDHLHRVICNLLDNAAAYGREPISVRAHRQGARVEIEVADVGEGVPKEFVARLFDKFSRSDYSRSEGTGLGLAITAGLVKANAGSIRYEENEPRGANFIVSLPAGPQANRAP